MHKEIIKKPEDIQWIEGTLPEPCTDYMGCWALAWIAKKENDEIFTVKSVCPWGDDLNTTRWCDLMGCHDDYYVKYYAWVVKEPKCEHKYVMAGGLKPAEGQDEWRWKYDLRVVCEKCKAHFKDLPDVHLIVNIPHPDEKDCSHTCEIFHPFYDFYGKICLSCGRLTPEKKPTDEEMKEFFLPKGRSKR